MTMPRLASSRWWYIMPIVSSPTAWPTWTVPTTASPPPPGWPTTCGSPRAVLAAGRAVLPRLLLLPGAGAIYAEKRSVKKLIFVSLILWGGLATLTGMVANVYLLIGIRFLLGVVEAAVMPAMLVYLCHWFTRAERSRANTFLISATR